MDTKIRSSVHSLFPVSSQILGTKATRALNARKKQKKNLKFKFQICVIHLTAIKCRPPFLKHFKNNTKRRHCCVKFSSNPNPGPQTIRQLKLPQIQSSTKNQGLPGPLFQA